MRTNYDVVFDFLSFNNYKEFLKAKDAYELLNKEELEKLRRELNKVKWYIKFYNKEESDNFAKSLKDNSISYYYMPYLETTDYIIIISDSPETYSEVRRGISQERDHHKVQSIEEVLYLRKTYISNVY